MDERLHRSWLLLKRGSFEQSERETRAYISANPDDPQGHIVLADCLNATYRYDEAIKCAKRAISLEPDNSQFHWLLGVIYLRSQKLDLAETSTLEALNLDPEVCYLYASLSEIYYWKGRIVAKFQKEKEQCNRRGIEIARAGLEIDAEDLDCLFALCMNLLEVPDPKSHTEALSLSQELLSLDPENAAAYQLYASALFKTLNGQPNRHDVNEIMTLVAESLRLS